MKRTSLIHLSILRSRQALLAGFAAALLAGCGGGGGSTAPLDPFVTGSEVPQSATASATGAFAFLRGLLDMTSESTEPIVVGDAVLGTSETAEPESF